MVGRRPVFAAALAALVAAASAALLAPGAASAHAYLVSTTPAASQLLESAPRDVALTFDEAVEPRFALVSVTDVDGTQETTAPPHRSASDADTLVVPLRHGLRQGWYLILWRAVSVDGHPVSGVFTYAVGPNPGPAPQFVIPHLSATATTPGLLITRWLMFLTVLVAIGLLAMRMVIARPAVHRGTTRSLRPLSVAFVVASSLALVAIPVYLDVAIANDALRSAFDVTNLVPLYGVTEFGRGFLKMELCFALFCVAAWTALWVDRPDRATRSLAELMAGGGAMLAAAAVLIVPGVTGHAAQTSPRGLSLLLDFTHLLAGSIWLGGLVGLLVLWLGFRRADADTRLATLRVVVPRFSNVAFVSVLVLLASGTGATIVHMPALDALWKTGYGVAILVKIGLLALALVFASVNLRRSTPGLAARERSRSAAALLRAMVSAEAVIVTGAVFTAAILSSLPPPPPSFVLEGAALAHAGPGKVVETVQRAGYKLQVLVTPNKAAEPNSFALRITKDGAAVTGADVTLTFNQLDMQMPQQEYSLKETSPGVYARSAPALVMVGKWSLAFQITPHGATPFTAVLVDQANG